MKSGRTTTVFTVVLLAILGAIYANLCFGAVDVSLPEILDILKGQSSDEWLSGIFLEIRLPRALTALLSGFALAVAGYLMQTVFSNPLAGPDVLGVNSGASLGIALLVLSSGSLGIAGGFVSQIRSMGQIGLVTAASLGALFVMAIIQLASLRIKNTVTLLVLGMMFGYGVSSLVNIMISFAMPIQTHGFIAWSFGSFSSTDIFGVKILAAIVLASSITSLVLSKGLDALLLGEDGAATLGVKATTIKRTSIALSSIMTGATTAFCGPIAFLGIAVPHISRMALNTSRHRVQLPLCGLIGSLMALLADVLSRLPGDGVALPVNAIMSVLGIPVVLFVILKNKASS